MRISPAPAPLAVEAKKSNYEVISIAEIPFSKCEKEVMWLETFYIYWPLKPSRVGDYKVVKKDAGEISNPIPILQIPVPSSSYDPAMTYYHEQVLQLKKEIYPDDHLVLQVINAKQFIDIHYARNPDLQQIAGEAFYSKFHFIRLFKSMYGRTPYQYLTSVRIQKAKEILQSGQSIPAACYTVGFESISSFSGLFKRITGISPSACRRIACHSTGNQR